MTIKTKGIFGASRVCVCVCVCNMENWQASVFNATTLATIKTNILKKKERKRSIISAAMMQINPKTGRKTNKMHCFYAGPCTHRDMLTFILGCLIT